MPIFQIFYDENSKQSLDPAFVPLDNQNSERQDWFEYWPIRNLLTSTEFSDDEYIGFLSPRFAEKTGLSGDSVLELVRKSTRPVISFSPFFHQNALFLSGFHQGEEQHRGCMKLCQIFLNSIGSTIDLPSLVQDQTRVIFSNYFVAKYGFWKKWLNLTEAFFQASENTEGDLGHQLRATTSYKGESSYPMKIFIMERLVSLVLETEGIDAEIGSDNARCSPDGGASPLFQALLMLDALKGQYRKTGSTYFLGAYLNLRKDVIKSFGRP